MQKFKDIKLSRPFSVGAELSQAILSITKSCHLKCNGCPLWKYEDEDVDQVDLSVIDSRVMRAKIASKKIINIVGGDPFKHPQLVPILKWVKQRKKIIRLWTHGQVPLDQMDEVLPYVDHVMIYIPTIIPEDYQIITGHAWDEESMVAMITHIRRYKRAVTIHAKASITTVEDLPALREWTYQHTLPLLIHYTSKTPFSKGSLPYITRFQSVPGVEVFKDTQLSPSNCPAICLSRITSPFQLIKTAWLTWVKGRWRYIV